MYIKYNDGWIEVITGPMFSGKSAELIARAKTLGYANKKSVIFRWKKDDRFSEKKIISRAGVEISAVTVENVSQMHQHITDDLNAIIIDEVQFYDQKEVAEFAQKHASNGKRVIVAGLDTDSDMKPFESTMELMAVAEFVTKLSAVCFKCGRSAAFTKLISGERENRILIGSDQYEARCRRCYNK